jgi:DNA-binding XRE family transcriptional regulator
MAKKWEDLRAEVQKTWSDEAWRVYEAASAVFKAEMDERARLGAQLAAARKARGFTQSALSQLSGIQQAEISRIERGAGNPTATTLFRLAEALDQQLTFVPAAS